MRIDQYMAACQTHPELGYYRTRAAIGAAGDFITAPEISQVFGELTGLWAGACWQAMGAPERWRIVELGPGRGTLMGDALRALKVLPAARAALEVLLIEASPVLAAQQREVLDGCGVPVAWTESLPSTPHPVLLPKAEGQGAGLIGLIPVDPNVNLAPLPTVVIGNEFLDALPIRQLVVQDGQWHERCVGLKAGGELSFVAGANVEGILAELPEGSVRELLTGAESFISGLSGALTGETLASSWPGLTRPSSAADADMAAGTLVGRVKPGHDQGGVAMPVTMLFLDYGHTGPVPGDTLQAVRGHRYVGLLDTPGEADLSAQVDFAQVLDAARAIGLDGYGPISQAAFLGRLGAAERLERLARGKDAGTVHQLQTGLARLMDPSGMGARFKAIALASKGLARPPGF